MRGVYLLHFSVRYKHAGHYLGYAADTEKRIAAHRTGQGARLMAVIRDAGITFEVARVWRNGTRTDERKLKNRGGAARLCPICRKEKTDVKTHRRPSDRGVRYSDSGLTA